VTLDPLEYCVHGVCLNAARAGLEFLIDRTLEPDYAGDDWAAKLTVRPAGLASDAQRQ
jgi:hypothetical protein